MATEKAFTNSGTRLRISASLPATEDKAGYEALSWTDVNDVASIGAFGTTYEVINFTALSDRDARKFKGNRNQGSVAVSMALNSAAGQNDAGQDLVFAALDSDNDYSFQVEANDNPGGTSNSSRYFMGKVTAAPEDLGNSAQVGMANVTIEISGGVVKVDSVA